ncbi:MAG: hypothetical protein DCF25_11930 [Leptolyngbya foveolarum]|uniref:HNH nuclease domain-containing protein n=1 Tax=Leptolyngbya foveolarum TaxID=47253 RepID=A0A2W4UC79_9CYAN|nr:MAG: hypothetical protein DCF25_11930 [Leptolyngbya foveolarum]
MSRYISAALAQRIRTSAQNRCGYCLSPQRLVMARLEIEHIIPLIKGGTNNESNLWLACPLCNGHKSSKIKAADPKTGKSVPLFNPRTQIWADHFCWSNGRCCMNKASLCKGFRLHKASKNQKNGLLEVLRWLQPLP